MTLRNQLPATALLFTLCLGGPVLAQNSAALQTRSLAATCAACHGTEGRSATGSAVVGLAGIPREVMVAQLKAFKDGSRPATMMHQLTKGYTDQQVENLATYFAAVKP